MDGKRRPPPSCATARPDAAARPPISPTRSIRTSLFVAHATRRYTYYTAPCTALPCTTWPRNLSLLLCLEYLQPTFPCSWLPWRQTTAADRCTCSSVRPGMSYQRTTPTDARTHARTRSDIISAVSRTSLIHVAIPAAYLHTYLQALPFLRLHARTAHVAPFQMAVVWTRTGWNGCWFHGDRVPRDVGAGAGT